ncbi:hypothetical protein [Lactobacillus gasseri]|nr:hypothetical protein [Lactobacillus gasseri]
MNFVRDNSYNLTADGKFRWITVTKDGITPHEILIVLMCPTLKNN